MQTVCRSDLFNFNVVLGRNKSDILLKTDLATVPLSQCNQTFLEYNRKGSNLSALQNGISESQYCAHDPNGNDSCDGDSGGPLQTISDDSIAATIIGIVSYGLVCGSPVYPSVYTRVAFYIDWIESHVWPVGEVTIPFVSAK